MIKLAIDITSILDQYANRGIGTYTRNMVKEFIKDRNFEFHLLGFKTEKENLNKLGLAKFPQYVRFHTMGAIKPSSISNLYNTRKLYSPILKKIKPDVYLCPNFERGILTGHSWKNIVVIHDIIPLLTNSFSLKSPLHNLIKKRFYLQQLKKALQADLIFTISNFSKEKLKARFQIPDNKIITNYLALDSEFMTETSINMRRANVILKNLRIKDEYILYFGGLESNKNVHTLIEAFNLIRPKFPNLKLVIVSSEIRNKHDKSFLIKGANGKKFADLVKKLKLQDSIIFTGCLDRADLKILTQHAKIFCHLSLNEGFGLSVLEAISLGVPTVISDIPVYRELFYENAVLVDPKLPEKIAESIINLIGNEELQEKLKAGKNKLFTKFTWQKHITKIKTSISQCLIPLAGTNLHISNLPKLAYIVPHFYPFTGGAENYTLDIATLASHHSFDVSVYTSKTSNYENSFDVYNRIKIFRSKTWLRAYYLKFYPGLIKQIFTSEATIFHAQGFGFIWQDICLILKKFLSRRKLKFINTPHGPFMARKGYSRLELLVKKVFTRLQKFYLNWLYDIVIEVNPQQYKWLEKEYGIKKSKIKFLQIGIDPIHFESLSQTHTKDEGKLILSYVGRFHRYKGVLDILIALERIIKESGFSQIKLYLMGRDAGELDNIKKYIIEHRLDRYVEIFENPDNTKRNILLDRSEIFIFPSEWEAYGIAMLEAMAHGNAIISTRTEGGIHLIQNNINGILYNHGNTDELFKAMARLIGNSQLREQMIIENMRKASSLEWENVWSEYDTMYRQLFA